MKHQLGGLVYSTELGKTCPECREAIDECICTQDSIMGDGNVRIQRESKGRGGKTVTIVKGLPLAQAELKVLLKSLKKKCGCGGSVKEGVIEIQGDKRELLLTELKKAGYDAKLSGG